MGKESKSELNMLDRRVENCANQLCQCHTLLVLTIVHYNYSYQIGFKTCIVIWNGWQYDVRVKPMETTLHKGKKYKQEKKQSKPLW